MQIAALDMAGRYHEIAAKVREHVVEQIDDEYGLDCPQLLLVNISLPDEVEKAPRYANQHGCDRGHEPDSNSTRWATR